MTHLVQTMVVHVNLHYNYDIKSCFYELDKDTTSIRLTTSAWTPDGMLSINLNDTLTIKGNLWQDWHIAPLNP